MLDATRLRVLVAVARHGSVTAAAHALNYAQPSISHHMARLEAETGAKLMERAGRGVKLTDAGRLLAERAEEILGRLDAAEAELAAHVGLRQDRVRLAAFGSALGTIVADAGSALNAAAGGPDILLTQADPADAIRMLRSGEVDVALVFRYIHGAEPAQPGLVETDERDQDDLRYQHVLDEPVYLITQAGQKSQADQAGNVDGPAGPGGLASGVADLAGYSSCRWIAGCEQCRKFLISLCRSAGFTPNIAVCTDDYAAAQALVAAGIAVTIAPALALRAATHQGIRATRLSGARRQVMAVAYGSPPDPPASSKLVRALVRAAARVDR